MTRLIDADKLADEFYHMPELVYTDAIARCIEMQPTVDAVPVIHGHWIGEDYDGYSDGFRNPVYYTYRCSECGKLFETDNEPIDFDYCPHCGAKMDKKECEQE